MFVSHIHVLLAAYLMRLAAAAPMGPVNMLAIRRGMMGGWRHTLAFGIGSVAGDLILFSLVLFGGRYLLSDLSPTFRTVLAVIGVIVLLPLGLYFLVRAVKEPLRAYDDAGRRRDEGPVPTHLAADVATGTALTLFNPTTMVYWVGVTANWLPFARSILGANAPGWGIPMAAAGLMTWFTTLTLAIRFMPHRLGPTFFRLVNATLGFILLAFATLCAIVVFSSLKSPAKADSGTTVHDGSNAAPIWKPNCCDGSHLVLQAFHDEFSGIHERTPYFWTDASPDLRNDRRSALSLSLCVSVRPWGARA
jgi:putative LysE/RhtB family amino acid efflux pump